MQIKGVILSCGLGLLGLAGAAHAALVPCTDATVYAQIAALPADRVILLSGASAPQSFLSTLAGTIFQGGNTGNIDLVAAAPGWCAFYSRPTGSETAAGVRFRAFFGKLISTAGGFPDQFVLFEDRAKGGSVWGVNPVARAEAIAWMPVTSTGCNPAVGIGTASSPVQCNETGSDTNNADPGNRVPDFGVSDVAPYMFKGPYNVEFGATQLTSGELANISASVKPINELMMGYVVTRRKTLTNPAGPNNATFQDIVADTYKMTRGRYSSMITGVMRTWSAQGVTIPSGNNSVVVCRRVPGSGTEASYNWYFDNFPCTQSNTTGATGTIPPTRMTDSDSYNDGDEDGFPDSCWNGAAVVDCTTLGSPGSSNNTAYVLPPTGYTVVENSASGNVRDCLTKAANGTAHTFQDEGGKFFRVDFGTGGYGAIGILSVDSLNNAQYCLNGGVDDNEINAGFTFRNEDGTGETYNSGGRSSTTGLNTCDTAAPSYVSNGNGAIPRKGNLICGGYDFAVELTMQYRTVTNALAGSKKSFVDFFVARAGDPAFNTQEWVAAIPNATLTPARLPTVDGNVAAWTRANQCAPLLVGSYTSYTNQCPAPNRPF